MKKRQGQDDVNRQESKVRRKFKLTPERRRKLKLLIMKQAMEDLKLEAEKKVTQREEHLSTKVQPLILDGLTEQDLIELCESLEKVGREEREREVAESKGREAQEKAEREERERKERDARDKAEREEEERKEKERAAETETEERRLREEEEEREKEERRKAVEREEKVKR